MIRPVVVAAALLAGLPAVERQAGSWYSYPVYMTFLMPEGQFARFKNRPSASGEGSCVQASIACQGAHAGVPAAEFLLENSPYGPAELGGSWPERVERYAQSRGMAIYNVEGTPTIDYIDWALERGCYVSITYGQAHMINTVGRKPSGEYILWDNNFPTELRTVDRSTFLQEHRSYGGGWCVILRGPAPPPWQRAPSYIGPDQ